MVWLGHVLISSSKCIQMDRPWRVWNKYTCNRPKGCVLEVDVQYPKELSKLHND